MNHKLEFDSIQLSFGDKSILSSVYMFSETGSITGLLGRNGCGKTTLMRIVFGSLSWEQKSVRIDSISIGNNYLPRQLITYLPQDQLIPDYLTIAKAFSLYNISEAEVILTLRSKALFCLLDEPFTGLTPVYIERIKGMLQKAKAHKGIIITDHMHRHVVELSDNLYLLANGQTYHVRDMEQLVTLGYVNAV